MGHPGTHRMDQRGQLATLHGRPALRFERRLPQSPAAIWRALTDSALLSQWFPADLVGTRAVGEPIQIVSFTGRFAPAAGRFTTFEPGRVLEYTWGQETLRWDLHAADSGSVVVFTNVLDDQAVATGVADIAAAWHACLDVLEFVLAGERPPYSPDDRFAQVRPAYDG